MYIKEEYRAKAQFPGRWLTPALRPGLMIMRRLRTLVQKVRVINRVF